METSRAQWREKSTQNVWIVSGIIAERAKRQKAQKKPIVLSDGPQGVEWGNGNLKGSFEDGMLVWRNRRGEATYCWKKFQNNVEVPAGEAPVPITKKVKRTPPVMSPPPLPINPIGPPPAKPSAPAVAKAVAKAEDLSPRSTNSAGTTETAALSVGLGNLVLDASNADGS